MIEKVGVSDPRSTAKRLFHYPHIALRDLIAHSSSASSSVVGKLPVSARREARPILVPSKMLEGELQRILGG
jgi:hypothetical protein